MEGEREKEEKRYGEGRGRSRQSRPRPRLRAPPSSKEHASRHIQNGGRAGPLGLLSASKAAISTPIMAAPRPPAAAPNGVLETCGLEQILEALKLLLSPGGEKTNLGAWLD